jgi:hypothetical protein
MKSRAMRRHKIANIKRTSGTIYGYFANGYPRSGGTTLERRGRYRACYCWICDGQGGLHRRDKLDKIQLREARQVLLGSMPEC